MEDSRGDAELLRALRDGDRDAYVVLWERHIGAALRQASRLLPSRAEDLVSEAFLAIYQQVTTTDKGPEFAFRSYLKAVIRNIAIRWRTEAYRVDDTADADRIDFRDALSLVEREADANELLGAFQELPERWQRVLWLAEVADVARPEIAKELGIKPNAVSALHRRARSGLRFQWLTKQVPALLRDDPDHVARLLPRHLTEPDDADLTAEISAHVDSCIRCGELLLSLRSDARRLQGVTLSAVGFGALGVAIPSGSALAPGTAAAAALITASTGFGVASLLAGGVGAFSIGGLLLATILVGAPVEAAPSAIDATSSRPVVTAPQTTGPRSGGTEALPSSAPTTGPHAPTLGRRNADPSIDSVDLVNDPDADLPTAPDRPQTAPGTTPGPSEEPTSALTPGVTTPSGYSGYLPPTLAGTATPGSAVAVEIDGRRYTPDVAADGAWAFDPRTLQLAAGTHDYRAWSFDAQNQSAATMGSFTVLPIVVAGFEELTGMEDMLVEEASTTGIVISATGPANGRIYVSTMEGYSAVFALDATGHAVKRLRVNAVGWYWFTFRALDADGFWGPPEEHAADVYDPDVIFGPWGPSPEDMTFDIVDP
ncbi:sigma-70 family RNA polymerase sigma factor [Microbacterium sp. NPDC057944]|uniref:sigma-70 family RNA polymerase sigma factor n=1 Tax=Microbacterium sp. NPDC057944 TaxID=3346286 RepID=UPI0036DB6F41